MKNKSCDFYPGKFINVDEVKNYSEIDLYLRINSINEDIWLTEYLLDRNIITEKESELEDLTYALQYLIYQTKRFGVEIELPNNGFIEITESYQSWYDYYNDHFQGNLTDDEWQLFNDLRASNKDYSMFLPTQNWSGSFTRKQVVM